MKFLIDEDVPVKLLKTLAALGHDAVRVKPSSSDPEIAQLAKREERILIIQIHPPEAPVITEAFQKLVQTLTPQEFRGLIVLLKDGPIRIPE